jgi:hypothetical protein
MECSCNHCCSGKSMSITQPECVCVCVCVCICSLRYPACNARAPYCHLWPICTTFFHIFSQTPRFSRGKKVLLKVKHVFRLALQLLSEVFLIVRRIQVVMIESVYQSAYKIPVIILRFWRNFEFFSTVFFSKNIQISNFMKIRPLGAELFYAGGRAHIRTWRS